MRLCSGLFFSTASAATETYTLSLHDALPIFRGQRISPAGGHEAETLVDGLRREIPVGRPQQDARELLVARSEEHTSELQSPMYLVCRLLLEKKKTRRRYPPGNR